MDHFLLDEGCKLTKVVNLPEIIYGDLASISDDLTSLARKPISPAMTISLLISVYRAYVSEPCARDAFCGIRSKIAFRCCRAGFAWCSGGKGACQEISTNS
jgi:hypothetical protein